ncbi:uncharacterized protein BDV14DRAFT_175540 [Aspergillus stella-maris]|uniref:uncharacterized protein n=1 Tax=Aspergillus stella-maris TaxID=1810926 RepID=UPI003CCD6B9A
MSNGVSRRFSDPRKIPSNQEMQFFNATDPAEHAFLRRRVSPVYSMSYILSQEDKLQTVLDMVWDQFN